MIDKSVTIERPVLFRADVDLEGLLQTGTGKPGVIITHPHPQYGGTMENKVVSAIQKAYRENGFTTLRFNFRGVGKSGGAYDSGIGEQEDVAGAVAYLIDLGCTEIDLAGYSFGTWVNASAVKRKLSIKNMIMVSPPVAFMDFSDIGPLPCLKLVITGQQDEIAPAAQVERLLPGWNRSAALEVLSGADHFYTGYLKTLSAFLSSHLTNQRSEE